MRTSLLALAILLCALTGCSKRCSGDADCDQGQRGAIPCSHGGHK
jgi:hypothetical protein